MSACEPLPGVIFVMIGPGGAGKNAIMKALIAEFSQVQQLATATTRKRRADEEQGREHLFISRAQFTKMIERGELLEYQEVTSGKYYGIPRQTVADGLARGAIRIADIEVLGAKILAEVFAENVVQIFVTVAGAELSEQLAVLRKRMLERADQSTDVEERLHRAKTLELPYQDECDYIVVNDELAQAINCTRSIVERELQARGLKGASP